MTANPFAKASDSFKRINPQLFNAPLPQGLRHTVAQSNAQLEILETNPEKAGGKKRYRVCIERRGLRLLDVDNLYGSVKWVCDGLRHEKLIPDDDPETIELVVTQRKVSRKDIGTEVTIERIL